LLWYILNRHAKGFSDIGLRWNLIDLALTPVLWALCCAAYYALRSIIWIYAGPLLDSKMDVKVASYLFSAGVTAGTVLFGILNPFFEELIVRAYLMTQLRQLGCNLVVVVAASVLVQTSYHFYQGAWAALSHMEYFSFSRSTTRKHNASVLLSLFISYSICGRRYTTSSGRCIERTARRMVKAIMASLNMRSRIRHWWRKEIALY